MTTFTAGACVRCCGTEETRDLMLQVTTDAFSGKKIMYGTGNLRRLVWVHTWCVNPIRSMSKLAIL